MNSADFEWYIQVFQHLNVVGNSISNISFPIVTHILSLHEMPKKVKPQGRYIPITNFIIKDDEYDTTPIVLQSTNEVINLPVYN